jgi:hypothetical protein
VEGMVEMKEFDERTQITKKKKKTKRWSFMCPFGLAVSKHAVQKNSNIKM